MSCYHFDDPVREALVNAAGKERAHAGRAPTARKPGQGSLTKALDGRCRATLRGEYLGTFSSEQEAEEAIAKKRGTP